MAKNNTFKYEPDYAVHPGEILQETLEARGISQAEFAKLAGRSSKQISLTLNGRAPITPESAIRFERILGTSASLLLNLNADYSLFEAKRAEKKVLNEDIQWADKFPLREMIKRKLIPECTHNSEIVEALLSFFGVGSVESWRMHYKEMTVRFRQSPAFNSSPEATTVWLQIGINYARRLDLPKFNPNRLRKSLDDIRKLTNELPEVFEPLIKKICAEAGVALVFVPELKDTRLSGATCRYSKNNILLAMSLRYKTNDHFWFTLFHETGHILNHSSQKLIVDGKNLSGNRIEDEANGFAANTLISPVKLGYFIDYTPRITKQAVRTFARKINIAPGIVVGRLQKTGKIPYSWFNDMKLRFELIENS